jgi:hypothetical protein
MLITCASASEHVQETLSTLRFGERTAKITNTVSKKNELKALRGEVEKLQRALEKIRESFTSLELKRYASLCELNSRYSVELRSQQFKVGKVGAVLSDERPLIGRNLTCLYLTL